MSEDPKKKRRFPRMNSINSVLVKKTGQEPVEGFAKTKVIGRGGLMLVSDEQFGIGAGLEVLIAVSSRTIKAKGRVVYERLSEGGYHIGVEFLDISDADREMLDQLIEIERFMGNTNYA